MLALIRAVLLESEIRNLAAEALEGTALTFQSVDDVHGGDGLSLGVLGVGDGVADIRNWRPISLLNTDYKIISKALTFRLKSVIHNIVDIDQTCAVPGRSIIDNCHLIRNIIDYAGHKQIRTLILSLDLEKAFDKVSHGYLLSILKSFGFGPDFIQ